jgi:hypothetical protein
MSVEGATDSEAFEAYVKHFLAPSLFVRVRWWYSMGSEHTGPRG